MTADKLCGGMNNDIRAVLNGSDKIGSAEGIVNNQRQAVLVSKLCKRVDIGNIAVGVSESFNINGSRIVFYRRFNLVKVVNINKRSGNSEAREGVGKQVVGAAVNRFLRNKMSAVLTESLKNICNRGSARSSCKSCNAALKSSYSLFKNILG